MLVVIVVLVVRDLLWDDGVVIFQDEAFDVMSPQLLLLHRLRLQTFTTNKDFKNTERHQVYILQLRTHHS